MPEPGASTDHEDQDPLRPVKSDGSGLNQLLTADQSAIQELIDQLQPIDKYNIELPRIIACGDQSSGKSSVLEAISRLDFPRSDEMCTTFATELTLSRQSTRGVSVKIRWDTPRTNDDNSRWNSIQMEDLGKSITEAKETMQRRNKETNCSFFKDVLQVQASDPNWPNLTLIDLPGLVHVNSKAHDVHTVENIVRSYMSEKNTLILAVVSAVSDHNNQKILEMVKELDPDGSRTMGIITKADRIESSEKRGTWMALAKNQNKLFRFGLGWHVVRNRGPGEHLSFHERDVKEAEFFSTSPWKDLKPEQLGIDKLREKLSKIFEKHTREALPGIVSMLHDKLEECKTQLDALGSPRATIDEQQTYLAQIAQRFEPLIREAVGGTGRYDGEFFDDPSVKLRAVVRNQNDKFVDWMYGWGHSYETAETSATREIEPPTVDVAGNEEMLALPETITNEDFLTMIKDIQAGNRGDELPGTFNSNHINKLFRRQSKRWQSIARAHVERVWDDAFYVLETAARNAARNDHTAQLLIRYLIGPEMNAKRADLLTKLDFVLQPYTKFPPITNDRDFLVRKNHLQQLTRSKEYSTLIKSLNLKYETPEAQKNVEKCVQDQISTKREEYVTDSREILEVMGLYYQDALRTFINNVVVLVIESTLLYDLTDLFSLNRVQEMRLKPESNWMLQVLTSEPEKVRNLREDLVAEKEVLITAIDSCREKLGEAWVFSMISAGASTRDTGSLFHSYQSQKVKRRIRSPLPEYPPSAVGTPVKNYSSSVSPRSESIASSRTLLGIDGTSGQPSPQGEKGRGRVRSHTPTKKWTPRSFQRSEPQSDEL